MEKDKAVHPLEGQSLLDIALQETGDLSGIISIAAENGLPISSVPDYRSKLSTGMVVDQRRKQYYQQRKIKPVTGTTAEVIYDEIFGVEFEDNFE